MTDLVYLNKDKTAVVSEFAAGKKWQVPRAEAHKMGLLPSADKPVQERRTPSAERVGPAVPQKRRSAPRKKK